MSWRSRKLMSWSRSSGCRSVIKYKRPAGPAWEEYFEEDGVSEDFMTDRDQLQKNERQ